jgi:hypothetical protein
VLIVGAICLAACWHYYRATTALASRYEAACEDEFVTVRDVLLPEELGQKNPDAERLALEGWLMVSSIESPIHEEGGAVLRSMQLTRKVLRPRGAK